MVKNKQQFLTHVVNDNFYLFIYLSIYLFIYLFMYLFIYLFIYLSIYNHICCWSTVLVMRHEQ